MRGNQNEGTKKRRTGSSPRYGTPRKFETSTGLELNRLRNPHEFFDAKHQFNRFLCRKYLPFVFQPSSFTRARARVLIPACIALLPFQPTRSRPTTRLLLQQQQQQAPLPNLFLPRRRLRRLAVSSIDFGTYRHPHRPGFFFIFGDWKSF